MIAININKARSIWRGKLEKKASERIKELNDIYHKYIDEKKDVSDIINLRIQLRSISSHPDIESAQTIEELKNVFPSCLTEFIET